MTVCTRTLADPQDVAAHLATSSTCTIASSANAKPIAHWANDVELDILAAFRIDPERYTIRLHDLTPASDEPCPEAKEVRSLNYLDLSDVKPTVNGAYEVHFVLKDGMTAPTTEGLRAWQARWDVIAASPAPPPEKTTVTFCRLNKRPMRIDIASLMRPFPCDVHSAMRSRLGLMSEKELFQANFEKVFEVDLGKDEVSFHFTEEECEAARDIDELRTVPFHPGQAVRVHIRAEGEAEAEAEVPVVAEVAKKKGKKRSREVSNLEPLA
jgi:hypothetical protein